jgi:transketolase
MQNSLTDNSRLEMLDPISVEIRNKMLSVFQLTGKGHLGSAFSLVEILRVLFDNHLTFDKGPNDKLIISQGWSSLVYYYFLANAGQIEVSELDSFLKFDSKLGGCIESTVNGVSASTGSCGHGLPIGVGLAYAYKLKDYNKNIFVIIGDGELGEGSIWEAIMSAARKQLDNLIIIVDYNKVQCSGDVVDITCLEPLREKFESFGLEVFEVNGHSVSDCTSVLKNLTGLKNGKPKLLLSHTVMGKGISSIENSADAHWVGKIDSDRYASYYNELNKA